MGDIRRVGNDLLIGQGVIMEVLFKMVLLVWFDSTGANVNLSSQASVTWTGNSGTGFGSSLAFDDFDQDGNVVGFSVPKVMVVQSCILL